MKFEYYVVDIPEKDITIFELTNWLNQMGAQEWELTHITDMYYYFIRTIEIGEKLRKSQLKEVPNNDEATNIREP